MKITFQNHKTAQMEDAGIDYLAADGAKRGRTTSTRGLNGKADARIGWDSRIREGSKIEKGRNWFARFGKTGENGRTMSDIQNEAMNLDAAVQQNYRTVLSNTMSGEDYAKMEEKGFHFEQMDPDTAVTIVDKIKAEVAKSGKYIVGYTDELDESTLAAALGSETLARAVKESFGRQDIPLTKENLNAVRQAWDMTVSLTEPSDRVYAYMLEQGMDPEIGNFYLAKSSISAYGNDRNEATGALFYQEDIKGYYGETASGQAQIPQEQIDGVLQREKLDLSEQNRLAARNLIAWGLPVSAKLVNRYRNLTEVSFPVSEKLFADVAASALADGKSPLRGNLTDTESVYEKARKWYSYYEEAWKNLPAEDITKRRQLEEIRLRMTAEVNVKLIRSGFAIDTAPMEELVGALKQAEQDVAAQYFPDVKTQDAVDKYRTLHHTEDIIARLPGIPAKTLGSFLEIRQPGLEEFYREGVSLQEAYEKAQDSYEALMTAPRKDMGDSISRAFRNVDAILKDMGLELNKENRRAVRILGYNNMEINPEQIGKVREADRQVQEVIHKMTPASTLQMIRDGVNPLESTFEELNAYLDGKQNQKESGYQEQAESYSRFLYGLEKNKQITPQERTSYIGIYRLLHQIEASDGAAVGGLVNMGAQIQFSNLLSAVRSNKFTSMDVSVTDEFGSLTQLIRKGESISEQVEKAYLDTAKEMLTEVSETEETLKEYREENLAEIRRGADVNKETVNMLNRGGVEITAETLLAAEEIAGEKVAPFSYWQGQKKERFDALLEHLDEKEVFAQEYKDMAEELSEEVERATMEADNSLDVRSLKCLHLQMNIMTQMAEQEEYVVPMYVGDRLGKVRFTFGANGENQGKIQLRISLAEEEMTVQLETGNGTSDGQFRGEITGLMLGNTREAVMRLQKAADIFSESVRSEWKVTTLLVAEKSDASEYSFDENMGNRDVSVEKESYRDVKRADLYRIAKNFLQAIR